MSNQGPSKFCRFISSWNLKRDIFKNPSFSQCCTRVVALHLGWPHGGSAPLSANTMDSCASYILPEKPTATLEEFHAMREPPLGDRQACNTSHFASLVLKRPRFLRVLMRLRGVRAPLPFAHRGITISLTCLLRLSCVRIANDLCEHFDIIRYQGKDRQFGFRGKTGPKFDHTA